MERKANRKGDVESTHRSVWDGKAQWGDVLGAAACTGFSLVAFVFAARWVVLTGAVGFRSPVLVSRHGEKTQTSRNI